IAGEVDEDRAHRPVEERVASRAPLVAARVELYPAAIGRVPQSGHDQRGAPPELDPQHAERSRAPQEVLALSLGRRLLALRPRREQLLLAPNRARSAVLAVVRLERVEALALRRHQLGELADQFLERGGGRALVRLERPVHCTAFGLSRASGSFAWSSNSSTRRTPRATS